MNAKTVRDEKRAKIHTIMTNRGLDLLQTSAEIGIHIKTFNNFMNGVSTPLPPTLKAIDLWLKKNKHHLKATPKDTNTVDLKNVFTSPEVDRARLQIFRIVHHRNIHINQAAEEVGMARIDLFRFAYRVRQINQQQLEKLLKWIKANKKFDKPIPNEKPEPIVVEQPEPKKISTVTRYVNIVVRLACHDGSKPYIATMLSVGILPQIIKVKHRFYLLYNDNADDTSLTPEFREVFGIEIS